VGEAAIAERLDTPPEKVAADLAERGMARQVAQRIAPAFDATMGECILALYRSAAQPVPAELGRRLEAAAARPGLAVLATEDHFVGTDEQRHRAAVRAGAREEVLDGLGHWWMTQDPDRGAAMLARFWDSV
jgi:tRNA A37 threonylcarbamoyladenosine modification protein TsaB